MGLRPTADLFCAYLRDALKKELQRGQMKAMKSFVRSCYSEYLIPASSHVADNEREDGSLIPDNEDGTLTSGEKVFLGGLGLKFKFPGDAKKCVSYHLSNVLHAISCVLILSGSGKLPRLSCGQITFGVRAPSYQSLIY